MSRQGNPTPPIRKRIKNSATPAMKNRKLKEPDIPLAEIVLKDKPNFVPARRLKPEIRLRTFSEHQIIQSYSFLATKGLTNRNALQTITAYYRRLQRIAGDYSVLQEITARPDRAKTQRRRTALALRPLTMIFDNFTRFRVNDQSRSMRLRVTTFSATHQK